MGPPINNIGGLNQRTKSKIWVETLLSLVIGIDILFFERTTLDECVSIDIAEKIQGYSPGRP